MQKIMTQPKKTRPTMAERANTLRAGVLGANDGILTVVGVLFSVAAATSDHFTIFIAGLADLLACAFSMASGEYASVSAQKDTEKSVVAREAALLKHDYAQQVQAVVAYYTTRGVTLATATQIASQLMTQDALGTVLRVKYSLTLGHYMNPWAAAWSSLVSAASGGLFPLVAMTCLPLTWQWPGTILAVIASVALTGFLSAKFGDGLTRIAITRNVLIGIITMIIHYAIGQAL